MTSELVRWAIYVGGQVIFGEDRSLSRCRSLGMEIIYSLLKFEKKFFFLITYMYSKDAMYST
jgi:hypothetical protein